MLVAAPNKASETAGGELDTKEIPKQLAGTRVGNGLTGDQIGCHGLNACPILCRCKDLGRKGGTGQMQADRTLLLFHLMLSDPEPFDWQAEHLSPFGDLSLTGVEVLMAVS